MAFTDISEKMYRSHFQSLLQSTRRQIPQNIIKRWSWWRFRSYGLRRACLSIVIDDSDDESAIKMT